MSDKQKNIKKEFSLVNTFLASMLPGIFICMVLHAFTAKVASWYLGLEVSSDVSSYYTGSEKTTSVGFYARNIDNEVASATGLIFMVLFFLCYVVLVSGNLLNAKYKSRSYRKKDLKLMISFLMIFVVILLVIKLDSSRTIVNYLLF